MGAGSLPARGRRGGSRRVGGAKHDTKTGGIQRGFGHQSEEVIFNAVASA